MRVPNVQFPNICRDKRGRRELEATSIAQAVLPASTDYLTPYDTRPPLQQVNRGGNRHSYIISAVIKGERKGYCGHWTGGFFTSYLSVQIFLPDEILERFKETSGVNRWDEKMKEGGSWQDRKIKAKKPAVCWYQCPLLLSFINCRNSTVPPPPLYKPPTSVKLHGRTNTHKCTNKVDRKQTKQTDVGSRATAILVFICLLPEGNTRIMWGSI